jgi:hypothetical protein
MRSIVAAQQNDLLFLLFSSSTLAPFTLNDILHKIIVKITKLKKLVGLSIF